MTCQLRIRVVSGRGDRQSLQFSLKIGYLHRKHDTSNLRRIRYPSIQKFRFDKGGDIMCRSFLTIMLFVLAVMAANPAMSGSTVTHTPKTVVEACTESYKSAPASGTCSNEQFTKVLNQRCRINADCRTSSGGTRSTWKVVERKDAYRLQNCDGWLKLDNC